MRGLACRGREHVAGFDRKRLLAESVLALARENEEHLVGYVMRMERKSALAGRHYVQCTTQTGHADERSDAAPSDLETLTVPLLFQRGARYSIRACLSFS